MSKVYLFASTGRCGTQWLTDTLSRSYGDIAEVTHEPLDAEYRPREFLRSYDDLDGMMTLDAVRAHLDHVERIITDRIYVETGWPTYAAIPLFIRRFGESNVGIVRLARHPVPVAASFVTHGFWNGRADGYATHGVLDPWAPGVVIPGYAERWKHMTAYEKCLYWWAELHLYADELRTRYPQSRFYELRFEALFGGDGSALEGLVRFLGLPDRSARDGLTRRVDDHQQTARLRFDWWEIFDHPRVLAVAESLGYKIRWEDSKRLRGRYGARSPRGARKLLRPLRWARSRYKASR